MIFGGLIGSHEADALRADLASPGTTETTKHQLGGVSDINRWIEANAPTASVSWPGLGAALVVNDSI